MLRSLIAGVLALAAVSACGKSSDAPSVVAGATAGKVIAADGDVTATRGAVTRKLAKGDVISGDDTIKTGSGASVQIWLSHNNATWSLEGDRSGKVGDSAAWKLARVDKVPDGADEATTAAGRYAEKSAADTSATARDRAASNEETPEGAVVPAAAPSQAVPQAGAATPAPILGGLPTEKEKKVAPPRPQAAPVTPQRTMTGAPEKDGASMNKGAPPPPPPNDKADMRRESAKSATMDDDAPLGGAGTRSTRPITSGPGASGGQAGSLSEIELVAKSLTPRLRQCLDQATVAVTLEIKGKKLVVSAPSASAKELSCMAAIASGQKIAGPDAKKDLKVTK